MEYEDVKNPSSSSEKVDTHVDSTGMSPEELCAEMDRRINLHTAIESQNEG